MPTFMTPTTVLFVALVAMGQFGTCCCDFHVSSAVDPQTVHLEPRQFLHIPKVRAPLYQTLVDPRPLLWVQVTVSMCASDRRKCR